MRVVWRVPLVLLGLGAMLSLGACGTTSVTHVVLPTATNGDIHLSTDRTSYTTDEPVGVTLHNASGTTYYAMDGHEGCTFLLLQEYDTASRAWKDVSICDQDIAPQAIKIGANQTEPFTLAPASGQSPSAWAPGTYRVAIAVATSPTGKTTLEYSSGFTIQS